MKVRRGGDIARSMRAQSERSPVRGTLAEPSARVALENASGARESALLRDRRRTYRRVLGDARRRDSGARERPNPRRRSGVRGHPARCTPAEVQRRS